VPTGEGVTVTNQEMIELTQALVCIPSVSGHQPEVAKCLAGRIEPILDDVRVDTHENVISELVGRRPETSTYQGTWCRSMPAPAEGAEAISLSARRKGPKG